jgi:hypothetical protein
MLFYKGRNSIDLCLTTGYIMLKIVVYNKGYTYMKDHNPTAATFT